jgi:hypothetical protein
MLSVNQITAFDRSAATGRENNDANNKIREDIIQALYAGVPEEFFADAEYGARWTQLKSKLPELCPIPYSRLEIVQRAGRNYNYDFFVTYFDESNTQIYEVKLEFKFGAKSVESLPQVYQKNTNWELIVDPELKQTIGYHEFFYDNQLNEILAVSAELFPQVTPVEKPDRESYNKLVMRTDPSCHAFFQYLRDTECPRQNALVKRSITQFLETHGKNFDIASFAKTIQSTQEGKQYLLYDPVSANFYLESADFTAGTLAFVGIEKGHTAVVRTEQYVFKLLLRWKNHQGVLNPAWQVSVKKSS